MSSLYPLKFKPIFKEMLWGGTKLGDTLGKPISSEQTGESWEISAVKDNVSEVANGKFRGKSLKDLIHTWKEELLGTEVYTRFGYEFPVLVKFIDAKMDLSVQVHPDDNLAGQRHNSQGKTEMWYVMDAEPESYLIIGFNRDVNREEYQKSLREGRLLDLMHYEKVHEGDTFMIRAGKIHAIGAGILLAEIQQTSDITYRVYDFNRKDREGRLRELHTDWALDAMDYKCRDDFRLLYPREMNTPNVMIHTPYFKTDYLEISGDWTRDPHNKTSFSILICVSGEAMVENEAGEASLKRGETVLLPASSEFLRIRTNAAKFLEVSL